MLQDFRIYVSNVRLIARDGREQRLDLTPDDLWQDDQVVLLDFEDATGNCNGNAPTNRVVRGRAPADDYVGLVFDIGVPAGLNHQDPTLAAPPLNFSALTWAWRYGYKFTTIDLETGVDPGAGMAMGPAGHAASGFSIHLGSVDCGDGSPRVAPGSPCATQNRPEFRLAAFNPERQLVVFDLEALLKQTDVTVNQPETASGSCPETTQTAGASLTASACPSRGRLRAARPSCASQGDETHRRGHGRRRRGSRAAGSDRGRPRPAHADGFGR